jgi:acyl dehydratase
MRYKPFGEHTGLRVSIEVRPSKSRPKLGQLKVTTLNQNGQPVLTYVANLALRRTGS